MPGQKLSARYMFRAITMIRPTRKSPVLRDIRRVITPYLEPGESIEICAVLYSSALAWGGVPAISAGRGLGRPADQRALTARCSARRLNRPAGCRGTHLGFLALSGSPAGATLASLWGA